MKKVALAWSGGKDSALALHALRQSGACDVAALLTTVAEASDVVPMHEVPGDLISAQAAAAGLPLVTVGLPPQASNAAYENAMGAALERLRSQGVGAVAFGDLYLEDVRAYREKNLARAGMEGLFPLWGLDTGQLARRFVAEGFSAVVTCVDTRRLDESFSGRLLDSSFFDDLPPAVDPCGENGEYHSFCWRGPIFKNEIQFERGRRSVRDGYCFTAIRKEPIP